MLSSYSSIEFSILLRVLPFLMKNSVVHDGFRDTACSVQGLHCIGHI